MPVSAREVAGSKRGHELVDGQTGQDRQRQPRPDSARREQELGTGARSVSDDESRRAAERPRGRGCGSATGPPRPRREARRTSRGARGPRSPTPSNVEHDDLGFLLREHAVESGDHRTRTAGRTAPTTLRARRPRVHSVTDRDGERVGLVARWRRDQAEQSLNHEHDLRLLRAPVAGDRGLHLCRGVLRRIEARSAAGREGDAARVPEHERAADVSGTEDRLERRALRGELGDRSGELALHVHETLALASRHARGSSRRQPGEASIPRR